MRVEILQLSVMLKIQDLVVDVVEVAAHAEHASDLAHFLNLEDSLKLVEKLLDLVKTLVQLGMMLIAAHAKHAN